jgi:hypothetical protein
MPHRHVLTVALAGLLAAAPLPAHAAAESAYRGGCGYETANRDGGDPMSGEHLTTGVLYAAMTLYSTAPADNPVSATLTCRVLVNGEVYSTATFSGTGVVTGVKRVSFPDGGNYTAQLCETIDFTSDDTPTADFCVVATQIMIPPQAITDAVEYLTAPARAALCATLATLAPGVPGVADISPAGDLTLLGGVHWSCSGGSLSNLPGVPTPPECSDGIDNDLDGFVDYPADPDCWGPASDAEGLSVPPGA